MRQVTVQSPSFPEVKAQLPLPVLAAKLWQVICGDTDHWRVGYYSPIATAADQLPELEQHTCPELFVLLRGRLTLLVVEAGTLRELPLEPLVPVLVTSPHSGFCPDGPHSGTALVVERDRFSTEYRTAQEWLR